MAKLPEGMTVELKINTDVLKRQIEALVSSLEYTLQEVDKATEPIKESMWTRLKRRTGRWLTY